MDLTELRGKFIEAVARAADESALEEVRLAALGKKGEISAMMATLGKMDPDQRKAAGAALNVLKDEIDAALRAKKAGLADAALNERLKSEWLDVTLPGRPRPQGTIHPVSQVMEELTAIFAGNDNMALGAMKGLRRVGRRVPDDVSLIGFDNIIYGTTVAPELTTIAQF